MLAAVQGERRRRTIWDLCSRTVIGPAIVSVAVFAVAVIQHASPARGADANMHIRVGNNAQPPALGNPYAGGSGAPGIYLYRAVFDTRRRADSNPAATPRCH